MGRLLIIGVAVGTIILLAAVLGYLGYWVEELIKFLR